MKPALGKIYASFLLAGATAVLTPDAMAAVTLNGNAPTGTTVLLDRVSMRGVTDVIKFKFTAGAPGSQVGGYTMGFCFQDPANVGAAPCGAAGEYVVTVLGGTSALAVVPASILSSHQLVVVNPTSVTIQFSVDME